MIQNAAQWLVLLEYGHKCACSKVLYTESKMVDHHQPMEQLLLHQAMVTS